MNSAIQSASRIGVIAIFTAAGLWLIAGGIQLLRLGGSAFFALAGLACLISAVLVARRHRSGAWFYFVFTLLCIGWALWESGFDPWALLSRIAVPVVLGMLFLLPGVQPPLSLVPYFRPRATRLARDFRARHSEVSARITK